MEFIDDMKELELFKNLMNLEKLSDAFYYSDQEVVVNDVEYTVRSFTYRLASWSEFSLPNALDSRGTAYYTVKGTEDWKLFCRAYQKFFNISEGISKEEYIKDNPPIVSYEKMDGSLILVGKIDGKLIAKSKTSLNSDQAQLAQKMLETNTGFAKCCYDLIDSNATPVFELIGPSNVIVLRYPEDTVIYLGSIGNDDGKIITIQDKDGENLFYNNYGIKCAKTYELTWDELFHIQENSKPDIEGYVTHTNKGLVKVKVQSYISLHALKDSINNIKSLTMLILEDNLDDLMGSYQDDQLTLDCIIEKQEEISRRYNHLVKTVEDAFKESKELERKEFAIKNKKAFPGLFGLLMSKYLGKEVDYKAFFMKNKMYEGL